MTTSDSSETANPSQPPAAKLPVLATQVGGALVVVLSDLERYVDSKLDPSKLRRAMSGVARLVESNQSLNTETRVATLVDLVAYYGEPMTIWLSNFLAEVDVEVFHLAIEYLHEIGYRGPTANMPKNDNGPEEFMESLCTFIGELRLVEVEVDVEVLDRYVRIIGLRSLYQYRADDLRVIMQDEEFASTLAKATMMNKPDVQELARHADYEEDDV